MMELTAKTDGDAIYLEPDEGLVCYPSGFFKVPLPTSDVTS